MIFRVRKIILSLDISEPMRYYGENSNQSFTCVLLLFSRSSLSFSHSDSIGSAKGPFMIVSPGAKGVESVRIFESEIEG